MNTNRQLMKNIFTSFQKVIYKTSTKPIILGRWANHNREQEGIKVNMTIEDHCGVCDQMRRTFINKNIEKNIKTKE